MRFSFTIVALLSALLLACNKDINERTAPQFEPTATERNGGTWRTVHLSSGSEPTVAAPAAVGSTAYNTEIEEVVRMQSNITSSDQKLIDGWKGSGIIKWNRIARELVAKYNIPPEANADGTYPVPSAANPGAYPKFPFANPPYASRAYAYLSTALYDALVACWQQKFTHNRMAPSVVNSKVRALENVQKDLPSFPSEDAVVAQVAYRVLKQFFPLDSVMLLQAAMNQKRAKVLSGAALPSDVAAAESIANFVADKALDRSRTDGMGAAAGNPALWSQLETAAVGRGIGNPWKSMDLPARPAMLPLFGNVKLWNISSFQRDSLRPVAPPAVGSPQFNAALDEVRRYAADQNSSTWRIALKWSDGIGSYTPPGHWNEIACDLISRYGLNELRVARTLSLMNMAIADAGICCWDTKTYYWYPRPSQIDGSIKTIGLPNFPSYTSGHSTFSGAAATVLGHLFPAEKENLISMASEASMSRVYGGIHYRFDCEVGLTCGKNIGAFSVKRAQTDGAD